MRMENDDDDDDDGRGEMVGFQHTRKSSEGEKSDYKRMVEMVNENERNECKEYMRAFLAYPCQDVGQPKATG